MKFRAHIILLSVFFTFEMVAQAPQYLPDSSAQPLSLDGFFQLIKDNHPVAKRAYLLNRAAQADILGAKGGFDPKLYGDYEQKFFDKKNYFSVGEYGVKLPTWYGIELKGAYNTIASDFTDVSDNPFYKLPRVGQAVFGASFSLVQGLLIDQRRADLYKARQGIGLNQADRDAILNDLGLDAAKIYWKWAYTYQQLLIFKRALTTAENRFDFIKKSYLAGDRMAMDTLESYTQVQDRIVLYNDAYLDFQDASLKLSNFLWGEQTAPVNFNYQFRPTELENVPLSISAQERIVFQQNLSATHPDLRGYDFKLAQLDVDRRLKVEKMKPKLNLNYNFLSNGGEFSNLLANNYKWGVTFGWAPLMRAERGDVEFAKIKIENTRLMRDQKTLEIQNKLSLAFNEMDNLQRQITTYNDAVNNYQRLLVLETQRFELGESTFFLINSREMKYLEAQVKLAKLKSELQIARASVNWASGRLAF